jgi:hypothetical protein
MLHWPELIPGMDAKAYERAIFEIFSLSDMSDDQAIQLREFAQFYSRVRPHLPMLPDDPTKLWFGFFELFDSDNDE